MKKQFRFNPMAQPFVRARPANVSIASVASVLCRFQAECNRPDCPYLHETKTEPHDNGVIEIKDEDDVRIIKVESDDDAFVI